MTWIPAIAIGGAILALGPILIHIIFRRRYRIVDFAAIRFLLEGQRRKRRIRTEELILIALRVLACLLLGLTLANIRSSRFAAGKSTAVAHVFVLDDSMSMGQTVGTATLFQKALAHVVRRMERMRDTDHVAILSACEPLSGLPLGRLAPVPDVRRDNLADRLAALRPTDLSADLPAALREAARLAAAQKGMSVRIYVVSDFRRQDLAGGERQEAVRSAFAEFGADVAQIEILDFGLPCSHNVAVERVEPVRSVVVAGVPAPMRVTLRNTATADAPPGKLKITAGEATLPEVAMPALAPGERTEIEFSYVFERPGPAALMAEIPADALAGDNRSTLALDVQDELRVLVIDGSDDPAAPGSASYSLARALDPARNSGFGRRVDVRPAEGWTPSGLDSYDAVVLANVRDFPASRDADGRPAYPALTALEGYVRDGGGLALFLGDRVSAAFYNGPFFAGGKGLSPLPLLDRGPPVPDREKPVRLDPATVGGDRVLRAFAGRGAAFSRLVRFHAVVPATGVPEPGAAGPDTPQVIAGFDNGLPAVCRRAYGRGTVLAWYLSLAPDWSDWSKDLTFVPVMNDMVWALARKTPNRFVDQVGRPIRYEFPGHLGAVTDVQVKTPAYPREDLRILTIQERGRSRAVSCSDTRCAGCYELLLTMADRTTRKVYFARRALPPESDLAKAEEQEIRAAVGRPHRYERNLAVETETIADAPPPNALWWYFVAVLVAVLCAENVLGQRFGHYQPRVLNAREEAR